MQLYGLKILSKCQQTLPVPMGYREDVDLI